MPDEVASGGGARPGARHHRQPLLQGMIDHVFQHGQRLRIGPVQVLGDQHRPGLAAQRLHQPQHTFAERDRRLGRGVPLRSVPLRDQPPQRRAIRNQLSVIRQPQPPARARQSLGQRPVRHRLPALHGTPGNDDKAAPGRLPDQLADETGLADASLAQHHHRTTAASIQQPHRRLELPAPADQHWTQYLRHTDSLASERSHHQHATRICTQRDQHRIGQGASSLTVSTTLPHRVGAGCPGPRPGL